MYVALCNRAVTIDVLWWGHFTKLLRHLLMLQSPHTDWCRQRNHRNRNWKKGNNFYSCTQMHTRFHKHLPLIHAHHRRLRTLKWKNPLSPSPPCIISHWQATNRSVNSEVGSLLSEHRGHWIWHWCTTPYIFTWPARSTDQFSFSSRITYITSVWPLDQCMLVSTNRFGASLFLLTNLTAVCNLFIFLTLKINFLCPLMLHYMMTDKNRYNHLKNKQNLSTCL